ncbi:MAG TPA: sulfur oxidation c-type cytochrome SoxX [Arcobacter sp.]|nr:sulfur oxidation c-type cytochrome SoxX [Arcobacter sp.]
MKLVKNLLMASAVSALVATSSFASHHGEKKVDMVKLGEKIFITKKMGNCLACHDVNGKNIDNPGSLGPKLSGLMYYPDSYIYDAIYDIYKAKNITTTAMPAFGKNGQLSDNEINALVAYLKTVN